MADLQLRQDVIDELEYDTSINAAHIGVAVDEGVVTLTGHVQSYVQKLAAERAVRRVKGVRAIAQELEIRLSDEKKTSDDEIAKRAADILKWGTVVPKDAVQITVHNGWVTLTGKVDWYYQRTSAEDELRKLSGVAGIINEIVIAPQVLVPDLENRIKQALRRNAEIEAEWVRVSVHDGNVKLEGKVQSLHERESVESAVWSAPGVISVEDHLTIE